MRLLLPALFLLGCAQAGSAGVGRRATDFSLPDLSGERVALSDHLRDREVVMISFWATWCRPCLVELPFLQQLYHERRRDGFTVLAISMDGPESESQVRPMVRRYRWTFPVLLDRDTRVVGLYNPRRAAPLSVLIGRNGKVIFTHEGFVPGDREEIRARVDRALAADR